MHPQPETYWGHVNPIGPRGVYDEAKRYAEALTMAYHNQQGVDTAIVRIFNTYGPRMRPHDGRAIPNFVRQALANEPLTVFGDGSQTRSFCYVDDLVRGLVLLAESGEHFPVNIGNPGEFTILELAQAVLKVTGSTSEIVFEALPVDDPQVRQPDITRATPAARLGAGDPAGGRAAAHAREGRPSVSERRWVLAATLAAAAGLCVPAATVAVPSAGAAPDMSIGVYDEGADVLRRPRPGLPAVQGARTSAVLRVNLYWGGKLGVAKRRPFDASRPARRRLRLVALRPHRPFYAAAYGIKLLFSITGTPRWANGGAEHEPAADELRVADLRASPTRRRPATAATYIGDDGRTLPRRPALGGLERAEQPDVPPAAVREARRASG